MDWITFFWDEPMTIGNVVMFITGLFLSWILIRERVKRANTALDTLNDVKEAFEGMGFTKEGTSVTLREKGILSEVGGERMPSFIRRLSEALERPLNKEPEQKKFES